MNLKGNREGYMGDLGGRKGEICHNFIIISRLKKEEQREKLFLFLLDGDTKKFGPSFLCEPCPLSTVLYLFSKFYNCVCNKKHCLLSITS